MKKVLWVFVSCIILLCSSCVTSKQFANYSSRLVYLENQISVIEANLVSIKQSLDKIASTSDQKTSLLDSEIKDIKLKLKNTNDLINTLRIEVVMQSKKNE